MSGKNNYAWVLLLVLLPLCMVRAAIASDDKTAYDRISLSAQASAEVDNDTLIVTMTARREGTDVADLSNDVNKTMHAALQRCKKVSEVSVQTLGYQTSPVYEKQHITGWQVSQSLQLTSHSVQAISHLIGELQKDLMLDSMRYEISPEQRQKSEEALIARAIAAFSKRAQDITQHLGRKRYRIVSMQVETGGIRQQPIRMRAFAEADKRAAPAVAEGNQTLTVSVNGVIELELN